MKYRTDIFEKYPIPKAVWSLALPTILGMLVTVIYNLADTFFVGQLNDVNQIAAVSITMPIFMLLMAIGTIFGIGSGTYISRMLGAKENLKVKNASSFSFYAAIFLGILCIIFGIIFMPQILSVSGASPATYEYAKDYLKYIIMSSPIIILGFSLGQIARAEGAAKEAMIGMMIGTVVNIILDPILILWAHMGVAGAAIATVIANFVSVLYYCRFFMKKNSLVSILPKDFSINKDMLKSIFSIGLPASLNSVLMSTSGIIYNNYAANYGDNVLAALGIVGRINMLPVLVLIGLAQGAQPLIGYNFAARNFDRMKKTINYVMISGVIIGTFFTILLYFGGEFAVKLFIKDSSVIELGSMFEKRNIISIPFLAVLFTLNTSFQSFGEGIPSLILSVSRQGLIFIPFLMIANKLWGLSGIVFSQPVADISSSALAIILLLISLKRHKNLVSDTEIA